MTLRLPDGLSLLPGQSATQPVPAPNAPGVSQVTWRVTSSAIGDYEVHVDAPNIGTVRRPVRVIGASLFQ